ncbi:MAG: radical SAM protein [Candidatus Liptonbacteria bacterium]|nr:radical SAM protein [Candidatus Liptonbacteria bacterium]
MQKKEIMRITPQIDVMVNHECNARCGMCIQEITWKSSTEGDEEFLAGVARHFADYHVLGGRKVIITGGEPTLRIRLVLKVLEILKRYSDLDLVAMYTNGSRLLCQFGGTTIAERLRAADLEFVNLSIHHWEPEKNNAVFCLTKDDPVEVARHLREIGQQFRFCATLQKGGLETTTDVIRYLEYAQACGAKSVYFRELFTLKDVDRESAGRPESVDYATLAFVPVEPIINECYSHFEKIAEDANFQGRHKREVGFCFRDNLPFFFSTLEVGSEEKDELPYLVVMPNGHLYSTWHGEVARIQSLINLNIK